MTSLTFIKFGGSVITDKRGEEAADLPQIAALARDLATARRADPMQRIILGHGSGSFGHVYAARYQIHRGLADDANWMGFALTAAAALRLNRLVVDQLIAYDVPAISLQPSTTISSSAGQITAWNTDTLAIAMQRRLMPVVHGDVAFDTTQGSAIISTEKLFAYLALHTNLRPNRIILVGENAVYTDDPHRNPNAQRIPLITQANIDSVLGATGASHGVDVTGGMRSKIELMWSLVQANPDLEIHLIGTRPGLLAAALTNTATDEGTRIRKG